MSSLRQLLDALKHAKALKLVEQADELIKTPAKETFRQALEEAVVAEGCAGLSVLPIDPCFFMDKDDFHHALWGAVEEALIGLGIVCTTTQMNEALDWAAELGYVWPEKGLN